MLDAEKATGQRWSADPSGGLVVATKKTSKTKAKPTATKSKASKPKPRPRIRRPEYAAPFTMASEAEISASLAHTAQQVATLATFAAEAIRKHEFGSQSWQDWRARIERLEAWISRRCRGGGAVEDDAPEVRRRRARVRSHGVGQSRAAHAWSKPPRRTTAC